MPGAAREWLIFVVLTVDAVLLAVLALLFLPLRLDGTLLPAAGDAPVPVVIVLAAITTPLLVSAAAGSARRAGASPALGGLPLIVWVTTLLIVAVAGPGGDQLVVLDWRALLLLVAGVVPSGYVLGRSVGRAARSAAPGTTVPAAKT